MTEIMGLRLAYRGLVAGLAAGYVWLAVAMLGSALAGENPAAPLLLIGGGTGLTHLASGIGLVAVGSGAIGLAFAYFFARFFTVRITLAVAGPSFAILGWLVIGPRLGVITDPVVQTVLLVASVAYGLMLAGALPVRGEVARPTSSAMVLA